MPVPAFFVPYVSMKLAVSEPCSVPPVIVGVAAALVFASYVFVFVCAVTVSARAVIVPLFWDTKEYV